MSYTVKFRELGTFHVGKDEVVETDEATLTIEGCKPDRFYSVEIQSDDGSARLQLHPILGEHGGEGDDEDQEPKPPRFSFKVVMRWSRAESWLASQQKPSPRLKRSRKLCVTSLMIRRKEN